MAIINVPAGGSIQAAIDSASSGDTIALAAGATYYEVIDVNGKDLDFTGPGSCIDGSMAEYRNGSTLWVPDGTFVGASSGLTYTRWKTTIPAAYPFDTSSQNEYGSIRIAKDTADGDLLWHYNSLADMNDPQQPIPDGEGYFVDSDRTIYLLSATNPNNRNLYIGQTTPNILVRNGAVADFEGISVKVGGRYMVAVLGATATFVDVDATNGGINIFGNNAAINLIGGTLATNYDQDWGWGHIKGGRMEESNFFVANTTFTIDGTDVCGGFNGIVAVTNTVGNIENAFVKDVGDDAYEFEAVPPNAGPRINMCNSFATNVHVGIGVAPIPDDGYFNGYNNIIDVRESTNDLWDWNTMSWSTRAGNTLKQNHGNNGVSSTNINFYNGILSGPYGLTFFSEDTRPAGDINVFNSIIHSTGPLVLGSTGPAGPGDDGVTLKSNLLWSTAFNPNSYWYVGSNNDGSGGNPSMNLSGQTLDSTWTDLVEADPQFANPTVVATDRASLLAKFGLSPTSPACDIPLCPVPADLPKADEANASECVGLTKLLIDSPIDCVASNVMAAMACDGRVLVCLQGVDGEAYTGDYALQGFANSAGPYTVDTNAPLMPGFTCFYVNYTPGTHVSDTLSIQGLDDNGDPIGDLCQLVFNVPTATECEGCVLAPVIDQCVNGKVTLSASSPTTLSVSGCDCASSVEWSSTDANVVFTPSTGLMVQVTVPTDGSYPISVTCCK